MRNRIKTQNKELHNINQWVQKAGERERNRHKIGTLKIKYLTWNCSVLMNILPCVVTYVRSRIESEKKKQQFRSVLSGLHDLMLDHACGLVVTLHLLSIVSLHSFLLCCEQFVKLSSKLLTLFCLPELADGKNWDEKTFSRF